MFTEMFSEFENDAEEGQKQKIEEINEILDEMDEAEFYSIFTKEMFEKIDQMIEKKKLTLENAILLLKHIGYHNVIVKFFKFDFHVSSLRFRIENMITEEEKKKEGKNEKPLVDLCECNLLLSNGFISEPIISVCVTYVLKVAMSKEEGEEARKDVEMALLALSNTMYYFIEQKLYLKEIKDIVQYHQEHRNLTRLAYQSVWQFLFCRLLCDRRLEDVILNKLQFEREAIRELEELTKCIDWKKNEDKLKEMEEENLLERWIIALNIYFKEFQIRKKEHVVLIECIVQIYQASRSNYIEICNLCICLLKVILIRKNAEIEDLLKGGAVEAVLEEIQRPTLDDEMVYHILMFFVNASRRLKEEERKEMKRKVFEKLEEEGYEDTIASLFETFDFLNRKYYDELSLDISNYFVNI